MKLLLDTNILIDILSGREGYEESLQILRLCEVKIKGFISAISVTDIMYIMRKQLSPEKVREAVSTLLAIVDVVSVTKSDINAALGGSFRDFEDAVQASCAARLKADYIVTRNAKDYRLSAVKAITPADLLQILVCFD